MGIPDAAIIRGLRQRRNEPQLTQALAALFEAEPKVASAFVRLLLCPPGRPDLAGRVDLSDLPSQLVCTPEEVTRDGRLDLRFRQAEWDVIVELKIDAGFGFEQLDRYLNSLSASRHAHLVAVTRDLPRYGEPTSDPRWLWSLQWRALLPALRKLPIESSTLATQWEALLDVLVEEGSMGFTKPEPALFDVYGQMRAATRHTDDFLEVMRYPLLDALREALGGGEASAGLGGSSRKSVITRSRGEGAAEIPFAVPEGGPTRVRAGLFAYYPPARFCVAPHGARRLLTSQNERDVAVCQKLIDAGFRPPEGPQRDLRALRPLDHELLESGRLEEELRAWAGKQFKAMADAGFFELAAVRTDDAVLVDDIAA
jgi:hypothetical protein